ACRSPDTITATAAARLIQRPTPRVPVPASEAGTETRRMITNAAASAPSAITSSACGTLRGKATPAARAAARQTTARPIRQTSFPSVPLFQPSTETVGPSTDVPEYQPVNADSASTSPATQVKRPPTASTLALACTRASRTTGGGGR